MSAALATGGREGTVAALRLGLLRLGRGVLMVAAVVLATSAATGWLSLLHSELDHLPGPRIQDALPLDELAGHAAVPLLAYLITILPAVVVLGVLVRLTRIDRLTGCLVLAAGVGIFSYLADAVSLFVVRQTAFAVSLRAAERMQPIYIGAALGGLVGALLGTRRPEAGVAPRALSYAVGAVGILDILDAFDLHIAHQGGTVPGLVHPFAQALVVPAGVLLLISARGLARGNRSAFRLALALLAATTVLQLVRGPAYPDTVVTLLVGLALVARRHRFVSTSDPTAPSRAVARLLGLLLFTFAFGTVVVLFNRLGADLQANLASATLVSLRLMVGLPIAGGRVASHNVVHWLPISMVALDAVAIGWAVAAFVAPWHDRLSRDERRRRHVETLVRTYGRDTLAPFALRRDKELFVYPEAARPDEASTVVAYRVVRGVAVVSSDPIGPPEQLQGAFAAFLEHARSRGWRTVVLGASGRLLEAYHAFGLRSLYHGDEAVIETLTFSLEGGAMKSVRQAAARLVRNGYRAELRFAGEIDEPLRRELSALEHQWLGERRRTGFVMQFDDLFRAEGDDALFCIGRRENGTIVGLLHFAVCHASRTLSLSSMPRRDDAPNGFNAWLIVEAIAWAAKQGYVGLSLNFSPFAGILDSTAELSTLRRLERDALFRLKGILSLQLNNLLEFNRKFCPKLEPRYVVYERRRDLPRVVFAAMAAEGYLPFSDVLRGWRLEHGDGPPRRRGGGHPQGAPPEDTPPETLEAAPART